MTWFRLYHEFITDQKVIDLPEELQLFLVKIWCVSSRQIERGTLPKIDLISKMIGVSRIKTERRVRQLIEAGFIDEDVATKALTIHGWETRQYESDDSTARKNRSQGRPEERPQNVPVTVHQNTEDRIQRTEEKRGREPAKILQPDLGQDEPFIPPPDPSGEHVIPMTPKGPEPPKPEVLEVARLAERLFPMAEFGRWVERAAEHHSVAVIEEALRRNHKRGKQVRWGYIQGTINGLEEENWKPGMSGGGAVGTPTKPAERPYNHPPKFDPKTDPIAQRMLA